MKPAHPAKRNVLQFLAAIPAVFVAVVSHFVACPACWPLVGGLISALGLTSLLETRLMLPLFVGCLLLAIAPLALQARHHLQPFILGLIASAFVLVGKFLLNATAVTVPALPFSWPHTSGAIAHGVRLARMRAVPVAPRPHRQREKRSRRKIFQSRAPWTRRNLQSAKPWWIASRNAQQNARPSRTVSPFASGGNPAS